MGLFALIVVPIIQPNIHRLFGLKSSQKIGSRRARDSNITPERVENSIDDLQTKKLYAEFSKGIETSDVLLNNVIDTVKTN